MNVRRPVLAALAALLALAGCSRQLDMEKLKSTLKASLGTQLGLEIASLACPDTREMKAGDTFECTGKTAGGASATVAVKQTDDQGNISWEVSKSDGLINVKALEPVIVAGLKEQAGVEAKADCGAKPFREAKVGDKFECKARTDSEEVAIEVTVTDRSGKVDWRTKPAENTDTAAE